MEEDLGIVCLSFHVRQRPYAFGLADGPWPATQIRVDPEGMKTLLRDRTTYRRVGVGPTPGD